MRDGVCFKKENAAANDTKSAPPRHAVRDSLASAFPLRETGKADKCIDQFLNWSMNAPPGLSDMIRIPYFQRNVPKSGIPERVSRFLARRKGFEPLRSSPLRGLLRNLIRFAQKTLRVLRSGLRRAPSNAKSGTPIRVARFLARRKGFEPLTFWSVARRSIQLS